MGTYDTYIFLAPTAHGRFPVSRYGWELLVIHGLLLGEGSGLGKIRAGGQPEFDHWAHKFGDFLWTTWRTEMFKGNVLLLPLISNSFIRDQLKFKWLAQISWIFISHYSQRLWCGVSPGQDGDRKTLLNGNRTLQQSLIIIKMCLSMSVPCGLENPLRSMMWSLPDLICLTKLPCWQQLVCDFCCFGTKWQKPTRCWLWHARPLPFDVQAMKCNLKFMNGERVCKFTGEKHVQLSGAAKSGGFRTKQAEEYPNAFAQWAVQLLSKWKKWSGPMVELALFESTMNPLRSSMNHTKMHTFMYSIICNICYCLCMLRPGHATCRSFVLHDDGKTARWRVTPKGSAFSITRICPYNFSKEF